MCLIILKNLGIDFDALKHQLVTTMKNKILLLFVLIPFTFFSQNSENQNLKTISGFITYKNKVLSNVNVFIENTTRFSVSDTKGFYSIKAKIGEIISFNYVGLQTKSILIEDVTSVLNIKMKEDINVIRINTKKVVKLGEGTIGDKGKEFKLLQIKGEELNKDATSLTKAILEKTDVFSVKTNDFGEEIIYLKGSELNGPAVWVIDSVSYDIPIPIYINEVLRVLVINYGSDGFIINVKTNINYQKLTGINYDNFYFDDSDYYSYDAISYKKIKTGNSSYLNKFKNIKKEKEALNLYLQTYSKDKNNTNYHYNVLHFFEKAKFSRNSLLKVLDDFQIFAANNPQDLKAIAYKYQELNEGKKAIAIYKKIVNLRPKHKQSYRDLANVFLELKDYRNTWLTYRYFLNKGLKIMESDIDEIITSEVLSTYKIDTTNHHQKIKVIKPQKNIDSDVRLVFEWNTTEAEFILEFVNPDNEVYEIENSVKKNEELIFDQKEKGYTSKEIFIKKLKRGNWLVNFTYLGNKHYKPTILKITTYYNWGRINQKKKIDIFNFTFENKKALLLKLNRRFF